MLKITKDSVPTLRQRSAPVPVPMDEKTKATLREMMDYLRLTQDPKFLSKHPEAREGVGLAAPQIGVNLRMLVISYPTYDEKGEPNGKIEYALVNPRIMSTSTKMAYLQGGEGCLSVDEPHPGRVYRHYKITVNAYDLLQEKDISIVARGYDAIVLQHEIDHLDGILFYDRIDKRDPDRDIPGSVAI